ncbi:MAG: cyclic pyranopterin monophosphate synthase MoaC [Gemmatales bacterium]|nr:cyclic pyranopterin monophosphate synthase MoaC [Gemmatales bacterium]MCS7161045.1 cyclic pyranopterin monophosphate synthase MoaC [Gemmatales bacterium]MDW8176248.1 cyclic pyranopterin monophosphate synthase MoaC [Gemmatales bacterium]
MTTATPSGPDTQFSHFDEHGSSRMVNTSAKPETLRWARASARLRMLPSTAAMIRDRRLAKGDVLAVAQLAGIQAVKHTPFLIPLCHPLPITSVEVHFTWLNNELLHVEARVECIARTGVEMEALTAVAVAALTVYDMCKAVDRTMVIENIQLEEKAGGTSGHFVRSA